jgi:Fur family transcriptional regulator, ferric uptake regulator
MKAIDLSVILRDKGYKMTSQREAIIDVIVNNTGKHLTIEEIYDLVRVKCPDIGLATVYRTITILSDLSLLTKLNLDDNFVRYELSSRIEDEEHNHHHLICNKCGSVVEVSDDSLDELEKRIEAEFDFSIDDHSLKFYGTCSKCKKKKYSSNKANK